jgi:hypothetical protein
MRVNSSWESIIRDYLKISGKENPGYRRLKHNKPCFDNECSKLIDQQKQAKLQLLQNPSHINGNNLPNLRRENTRVFKKRKGNI